MASGEATLFVRSVIIGLFIAIAAISDAFANITIERIPIIQDSPPVLLIKGEFELSDDPSALAREAAATGAKVVTFNSNGGNILTAIAYGRMIRSLGLSTLELRSTQCASACALAFVGGTVRKAEPGSIGVHQASFSGGELDGQAAAAAVQSMTATIMGYLVEMGVDPKLLQLSLSVAASDMRYLTTQEMDEYKVTTEGELGFPSASANVQAMPSASSARITSRPETPSVEERALLFMARYHAAWSEQNPQALAFMDGAYADTISFYGKLVSKAEVLADKRKFADRWPRRAYSVRHGSEQVSCSGDCTVSGTVEWFAESPERGRISSGAAEFTLVWNASSGKILSEIGRVIAIDKNASEPFRIISQWQQEDGNCRGVSGDSPEILKACKRREAIGAKLEAVGWCYGRPGEAGAEMNWHQCDERDHTDTDTMASNNDVSVSNVVNNPKPSDFPVQIAFHGKTKFPDFKRRDRQFNIYRTRIREGMHDGPNFAGHYSLIQIGCGTDCSLVIFSDNKTGKLWNFPLGGEDNLDLQLKFQLNSRLLTTQWFGDGGKCYVEFLNFDGQGWKSLKKINIGSQDSCYRNIDDNLH